MSFDVFASEGRVFVDYDRDEWHRLNPGGVLVGVHKYLRFAQLVPVSRKGVESVLYRVVSLTELQELASVPPRTYGECLAEIRLQGFRQPDRPTTQYIMQEFGRQFMPPTRKYGLFATIFGGVQQPAFIGLCFTSWTNGSGETTTGAFMMQGPGAYTSLVRLDEPVPPGSNFLVEEVPYAPIG